SRKSHHRPLFAKRRDAIADFRGAAQTRGLADQSRQRPRGRQTHLETDLGSLTRNASGPHGRIAALASAEQRGVQATTRDSPDSPARDAQRYSRSRRTNSHDRATAGRYRTSSEFTVANNRSEREGQAIDRSTDPRAEQH